MKHFVAVLLSCLIGGTAMAQQLLDPASRGDPTARANQGTVGVITGMEGGTYARTGADLTILDDDTLRVLPTLGKGSLQNLADILYLRGVDIGFVQADALTYARQHNLFPNMTQSIRYIAKLYDEEVHVLVRQDIKALEDLNGQHVNVDVVGSGSAMTADIILSALGINAVLEHDKQVNAVEALKQGKIAGLIQVGGAPLSLFADIASDSGIHLLPLTLNSTLALTYLPDQFTHQLYSALVPTDTEIPTIAIGDVMAVFAWQPHTERYNKVARFVDAFFSKFDQFRQPPRHPKWREVNLAAEVPGWIRFQPAQDWLIRKTVAGTAGPAMQDRFNAFLASTNPATSSRMTDADRDALFQRFVAWDRQHPAIR